MWLVADILDSVILEHEAQYLAHIASDIILNNQTMFKNLTGKCVALGECLSNT